MSSRLAELLARGQAGRLSPAETAELAMLLNAPLFDAPDESPAGFASSRTFSPSDVPARLNATEWFSRCGQSVSLQPSMPVEQVTSWPAALKQCSDPRWENVQLESQNQLSSRLHRHDPRAYARWNQLVADYKAAVIDRLTQERWLPYQMRHGLDARFVSSVQWDVLGALLENGYLGSGHGCSFFLELLPLYEGGHFPCGWKGEWPDGALLVY